MKTNAQALAQDSRLKEAKKLLLAAVKEHQIEINGVRPAIPELRQGYEELLRTFAKYRGNALWFPYLGSGIGNGPFVELLDGSVKYDFISGIGVHYLGHSHEVLIDASIDAAITNSVMQGHLQQNADAIELSKLLIAESKLDHCFLTTSGAMANENAFKIAFQKRSPANRVLAFERCFAGRSMAMAQITDKPSFRDGLPTTLAVDYVPFYDAQMPQESTQKALSTLKNHIKRYPKQHAVMIFELVQGENGFYPGSHDFFKALMEILKEQQITILVDEVQTFGRTSALFAYQHFGLDAYVDIVTIGKLSQVCATLFKTDHNPRPGLLSQTFTGSTSAIKSSLVLLKEITSGNYYGPKGKVMELFQHFSRNLMALEKKHPTLIRGPYGIGGMIAFTPYQGEAKHTTRFVNALFEAGVISFLAGTDPTRVRFLPPIGAIKPHDIDAVTKIVEEVLVKEAHP